MSNHFVRPDVQAFLDFLNAQPGPKMHELSATEARGMMVAMGSVAEEELGEIAVVRDLSIPGQDVCLGTEGGKLAVVGWGSTFGPIHQAVRRARAKGQDVSHIHVRHIWPMPTNLGDLLRKFDKVIVPEMNTGQFKTVLRDQYLIDAKPLNKVSGQPFRIHEIEAAIEEALA